ncbi:hypothetical protein HY418_01440 [Candidatus Kaiserbacteria bacterium]|nr:hypothetical protein [Candidatus Kaiserbacteria bacterium]
MEFTAGSCVRFGWETFKKRPWFFIAAFLLITVISGLINGIAGLTNGIAPAVLGYIDTSGTLAFFVNVVLQTFIGIGYVSFALKAHDSVDMVSLADFWRPQFFLQFLFMSTLAFLSVAAGLILLIVPGIIIMLMFYFGGYLVVDRSLDAIASLKESARITKGYRWKLLVFVLTLVVINILGALCLLVGLLVSIPVTYLATAHAYRVLEQKANAAGA